MSLIKTKYLKYSLSVLAFCLIFTPLLLGLTFTNQTSHIAGVVVKRDAETFTIVDDVGIDSTVVLNNATQLIERDTKKRYATSNILRGLHVEVDGHKNDANLFVADTVNFALNDLKVVRAIASLVVPLEERLATVEGRLSEAEQNAQRFSGQAMEVGQLANAAKGGAKVAQETADEAIVWN